MKLKDILIKNADGSYQPKTQISISRPDGNIITIGPDVKLQPGVQFSGIDIKDFLEREVNVPNFGSDNISGVTSQEEEKSDS
ncbi:MAG: hypothetical protein UX53_C0040G0003 [Candidatus Azambacteria bacterium GW2011_GWB2_46_37]|uniref:Uncharacterized protein n=3 Tax=Candidatus Azamiibacteriota TaxID=1752741 RepID=A0A0G1T0R4_9BACT|nr:MAG: hypothetical protein UX53_C0040G0003 [Candidatus Azambacteria bacterium GW2011_GWB2_46_37]KKU39040.1 MAG: hypothetical protein UX55_C0047G0011 [Candidatus Azambacteria bacterium GW2011_GWE2_46_45]KKU40194.1 MAG: hypothetical protein UX56_C0039G0002 [Candidatus Azambacteria bacterium GW2011_GWD2_46_48]HAQ05555.1 hypothetical protein [Candidatus Azambacteria bacterium]HBC59481.1 hypothetical protein [Candidatus Azambacteria bacterium]